MNSQLQKTLSEWPLPIIRDVDLSTAIPSKPQKRYQLVNQAIKKDLLIPLRRGLYLLGESLRQKSPSACEIAHLIYGPSYISFESALFYHQWIPEAVYKTICATAKRANNFETVLGDFHYLHVPAELYYLGVERIVNEDEIFYMATPWKAVADHYYVNKRDWDTPWDLHLDMRIKIEDMLSSDLEVLKELSENYKSPRVRKFLSKILRSLRYGNPDN